MKRKIITLAVIGLGLGIFLVKTIKGMPTAKAADFDLADLKIIEEAEIPSAEEIIETEEEEILVEEVIEKLNTSSVKKKAAKTTANVTTTPDAGNASVSAEVASNIEAFEQSLLVVTAGNMSEVISAASAESPVSETITVIPEDEEDTIVIELTGEETVTEEVVEVPMMLCAAPLMIAAPLMTTTETEAETEAETDSYVEVTVDTEKVETITTKELTEVTEEIIVPEEEVILCSAPNEEIRTMILETSRAVYDADGNAFCSFPAGLEVIINPDGTVSALGVTGYLG